MWYSFTDPPAQTLQRVCLPFHFAKQAAEFFDEVGGSSSPRSSAAPSSKDDSGSGNGGRSGGGIQWSQRALGKLQRFHQLKDESSIR